ncbi:hypothetical protein HanXRQr2_Chr10g0423691 [Helianthus annuus]|uniref:Uncharacterized protein n=1 Tax=Helianthus annuus TaxID=4232 RepID=A0A9K3HV09_HELAN|nr:hypothetical protein HanXRQr2_Chr10g0423691 [Helianthus annuus]KAJ0528760.1 hypothetical protein HanHA89_Chr10g0369981 [Helianthus annuus]
MLVMETKVLFSGKMQKHCCRVFLGLRATLPLAILVRDIRDTVPQGGNIQR